jgi:hypothetical protein
MIKKYNTIFGMLLILIIIVTGCIQEYSFLGGYDSMQDITFYPEKYQNKLVKVTGTVCINIAFHPSNPSYICLQDKYDNIIKLRESCGGDFSDSWVGRKDYVAFGVFNDGWIDCKVPIYKQGNEPPQVKKYESGDIKRMESGAVMETKECKKLVNDGGIEKCAE